MRLSIVIPYYNRRDKLLNVLRSIDFTYPIEVIIVDDGSDKQNEVYDLPDKYPVKLIRLEKQGWRGACIAYNTGFNAATGNMIMINSSECVHIGNVVEYTFRYFRENTYMAFAAMMGAKGMDIEDLNWHKPKRFLKQVAKFNSCYELPSQRTWWGVHSEVKNFIPYCAVISRKKMDVLGGYDERFINGIGYDDYDFTHRIKNLGLKMICVDRPFVFHQWHRPTDYPNTRNLDLLKMLNDKFPNRIKANDIHSDRN